MEVIPAHLQVSLVKFLRFNRGGPFSISRGKVLLHVIGERELRKSSDVSVLTAPKTCRFGAITALKLGDPIK